MDCSNHRQEQALEKRSKSTCFDSMTLPGQKKIPSSSLIRQNVQVITNHLEQIISLKLLLSLRECELHC